MCWRLLHGKRCSPPLEAMAQDQLSKERTPWQRGIVRQWKLSVERKAMDDVGGQDEPLERSWVERTPHVARLLPTHLPCRCFCEVEDSELFLAARPERRSCH